MAGKFGSDLATGYVLIRISVIADHFFRGDHIW